MKNNVSCKVNEICEKGKIKKPKSKYSPEKIFIGYKKPTKGAMPTKGATPKKLVVKRSKTKKVMYASKKK